MKAISFHTSLLRGVAFLLVLLASSSLPRWARADEPYPSHPLRMVVPFAPGGGIDILGRTVGQELSQRWKQPVVIDNRPGASGAIGTELAAKAPADGYTLLMTVNTIVTVPAMGKKVGYDPVNDFTPVLPVALGSMALAVPASLGVHSVDELVALAKKQPGKLNYGTPGNGTPHHLDMELFKQRTGIDLVHVPYKGSDGMLAGIVGGQVEVEFIPIHQALPQVRAGKLVLLSSGGTRRSDATPSVPSLSEAAHIADIEVDVWYGLYLPAGAPAGVVQQLNDEVNAILKMPSVISALERQGLEPSGGTPEELAELTKRDLARWTKIIHDANLATD